MRIVRGEESGAWIGDGRYKLRRSEREKKREQGRSESPCGRVRKEIKSKRSDRERRENGKARSQRGKLRPRNSQKQDAERRDRIGATRRMR